MQHNHFFIFMENNSNIPSSIIIDGERRKTEKTLTQSLKQAQEAYAKLRALDDLGEIPEPHNCTRQWLDCILNPKKEAVSKAEFLTKAQKLSFSEQWDNLAKVAFGYVDIIQSFISSIPYPQYGYDEETGNIYIKDFAKLVESLCVRSVPSEAQVHWQLIQNVRKAIQELRKWEATEDLRKYRLEELFAMSPKHIAELWAVGDIRIDHSYDHLPGLAQARDLNTRGYL